MNLQKKNLQEKIIEKNLHQQGHLRLTSRTTSQYIEIFNLSPLTTPNLQNSILELSLQTQLSHENLLSNKSINFDSSSKTARLQCQFDSTAFSLEQMMDLHCLNLNHLKFVMFQLFSLVNYFHYNGLVARNLCPQNILVSESSHVYFGDFSSMRLQKTRNKDALEHRLNINYAAPELSLNLNQNFFASDIWSIGCILFELAERRPLFRVNNSMHLLRSILSCLGTPTSDDELGFVSSKGTVKWMRQQGFVDKKKISQWMQSDMCNAQLKDLLDKCLKLDPAQRISAAEALAHPFFAELYDPEEEMKILKKDTRLGDLKRIYSVGQDKGRLWDYLAKQVEC
jgi:mitogen-activated protein kinase 1/3